MPVVTRRRSALALLAALLAFLLPPLASAGAALSGAERTIAGAGGVWPFLSPPGYAGDGLSATDPSVRLSAIGLAPRPTGGYYLVDDVHHRIRQVDANGIITTVAGNGQQCPAPTAPCGDGGLATLASLNNPQDVAPVWNGSFLIADMGDNRIRFVGSDGRITTVAGTGTPCISTTDPCGGDGGLSSQAKLNFPVDVTVNPNGGFLISDSGAYGPAANNPAIPVVPRIRYSDSTGHLYNIIGNGSQGYSGDGGATTFAQLGGPTYTAFLPNGNIAVVDAANNRIRKTQGFAISGFAGSGPAFPTPCLKNPAPADIGDGGPASAAVFNCPAYVYATATGGLVVSDQFNGRVRYIAPDSQRTINTLYGNGTFGFPGDGEATATAVKTEWPSGLAPFSSGFISSGLDYRVRLIDTTGGLASTASQSAVAASMRMPAALTFERPPRGKSHTIARVRCPAEDTRRPCAGAISAQDRRGRLVRIRTLRLRSGATEQFAVRGLPAGTVALVVLTRQPIGRPAAEGLAMSRQPLRHRRPVRTWVDGSGTLRRGASLLTDTALRAAARRALFFR